MSSLVQTNPGNESLPSFLSGGGTVSPALQIMLNEQLFEKAKEIARYMSKAVGFMPEHLIEKPEACFAVVVRSLTWKLDPYAVGMSTYQPAPGKVGFEGKLCQAIIENSGQVKGGVEYEPYGDWNKVMGKFIIATSDKGKKYAKANYTDSDEVGLGVIARAQVIGESKPREFKIDLRQAHPRNSTLWATDPLTQLKYRAARGLGNLAMPGIFMGVPFDREDYAEREPVDVTPPEESSVIANINKQAAAAKEKPLDVEPLKTEPAQPETKEEPAVTEAEQENPAFDNETGEIYDIKPEKVAVPMEAGKMRWAPWSSLMQKQIEQAPDASFLAELQEMHKVELANFAISNSAAARVLDECFKAKKDEIFRDDQ